MAISSDIILTLQMGEIWIFWDGILTVKTNGRVGTLIDKPFLCQNSLGQHEAPMGFKLNKEDTNVPETIYKLHI